MAKSPAVILFDSNGVPMAVEDGAAIPVGTQALLAAGSDGTNAHALLVDSSGRPIVVGAGSAGTPVGGVLTIQGVSGGTPLPVSGTITASNPSVGTTGSAVPASASQIGGSDGTNLQSVRVFDADTGAGSQFVLGLMLRKSGSGGSVETGTSTDPLRVDPTGTTTQPISASSLPLPTGAATETTLSALNVKIPVLGQTNMGGSLPVAIASNQSALSVNDGGGSLTVDGSVSVSNFPATQPVSAAALPLPTGAATSALQTTGNSSLSNIDTKLTGPFPVTDNGGSLTVDGSVSVSNFPATQPISATALPLPTGAATAAKQPAIGTAGTPSADVLTVQGSASMTALKVDGSAVTQPISATALPLPTGAATSANQTTLGSQTTKINDGTNTVAVSASNALKVDGSAVTQPVSGSVSVSNFPATQPISAAALPLPTGAATETTLASLNTKTPALGQTTMAGSSPVTIASNQTALPITDNGGSLTVDSTQLPASLVGGRLDGNVGSWLGATTPTVGQKTATDSIPVVLASDQTSPTVGTHANAWNAVAVGANGVSTSIDCQYTPFVSVFGTTSGATNIQILCSQDNTNFYAVAVIAAGTGDFGGNFTIGSRYVRLRSVTARTITATIAGKS